MPKMGFALDRRLDPESLKGPLVWTGSDFQENEEYVYHLSDSDKKEIVKAVEYFKDQGLNGEDIKRDNFPLPNLEKRLDIICAEIYEGRGFVIIRGLDPDAFTIEDMTMAFLGLTSHIGERRGKQDQRGSMLMHVLKREGEVGEQFNLDKPFHTDTVTDVLALMTRNLAAQGGQSVLASAYTVYNELAATRPDLIHVLAEPNWPFDTLGRTPPYYNRALMYHYDDRVITSFSRRLLLGHPNEPRTPGIPRMNKAQAEAIDALHFIARKHEIQTRMEKGDIRLINNMAIMHRREAFDDGNTPHGGIGRHLIRMWVNNEKRCWALPRPLRIA